MRVFLSRLRVTSQIIEDGLDFKKKVEEVLEETGFTESRAAKMDINDLLKSVRPLFVKIDLEADTYTQTPFGVP